MLCVAEQAEVYLYMVAADMRHGFERLSERIRVELKRSVISGGYYVFLSRNRKKAKVLYWDKDGYALWQKRLEAGSFRVEIRNGHEQITGIDLHSILNGVDFSRINLRKNAEKGLYSAI